MYISYVELLEWFVEPREPVSIRNCRDKVPSVFLFSLPGFCGFLHHSPLTLTKGFMHEKNRFIEISCIHEITMQQNESVTQKLS